MARLVIAVVALCSAGPSWAAGSGHKLTRALERERSAVETLEALSTKVVHAGLELDELRQQRQTLGYAIDEAERQIHALEQRAARRREQLRTRTRSLYKLSRGGFARLLLDARDGRDLARRLSGLRLILRRDVRERRLYRQELERLAKERRSLRQRRRRHEALARRLEREHALLQQTRSQQRRLLQRLNRSRRLQQKLTQELDRRQRRLLRQIASTTYALRWAGGLAARKGTLPRPVRGPVVGAFGRALDQRRRGVEVLRHGLTFRTGRAAPVKAVARGKVRLAGPLAGYGRVVLLDHGEGFFSLYGFLARVRVKAGEELGRGAVVGRTGIDPLTGEAALYFEIRRRERALDPIAWIRR